MVKTMKAAGAEHKVTRRNFLKTAAGTALAAPAILSMTRAYADTPTIKVGYVSPKTGPLAGFAEADDYIVGGINKAFAGGLQNNGKSWAVEIIVRDSQSNPNRAAEVASQLILKDEVDILLGAATPDTTNPVSDQAEINGKPCITTDCPWQPYFFGRGGKPDKGFESTYHFFWGLEDVIANFTALWNHPGVEKKVGGLFPNDADGNAWGDAELGFPKPLAAGGFALTDPGRYQPLSDDFSAQISAFKAANAEIITGVMIPPDFGTFWAQAGQQGLKPKIVTVGKALLFPSAVAALGRARQRLVLRDMVVAQPSLRLIARRHDLESPCQWLHRRDRQAVDAADRLSPCAVRSGGGRGQARGRSGGRGRDRRGDPRHQPEDHRRHDRLVEGAGEERLQDTARRGPMAAQG
ncbi:ABC-type branched-subunit amino acid transport system substrate-binding protein [Mesorhizobium sp. USDA 4775]